MKKAMLDIQKRLSQQTKYWRNLSYSFLLGLNDMLIANADILLIAVMPNLCFRYETSANTFNMLMYFLAAHPHIQDKVVEEIRDELGDERLTYDNVRNLRYLGNCLEETGRMHTQVSN